MAPVVKNLLPSGGDPGVTGSIPGLGRSPRGRNGNPLLYSCLGNPMDRGAWWATIHGVAKRQTQLSDWTHIVESFQIITLYASSVSLEGTVENEKGWEENTNWIYCSWPQACPTSKQWKRKLCSSENGKVPGKYYSAS